MRHLSFALCLTMATMLAACQQTYGPSSSDLGKVEAKPGEAIVVAGYDVLAGGPGLVTLGADDTGNFRLAFHAYDPATETLANPPRAFYIEQSCGGAAPGLPVCGARAEHAAVAVPAGDYILAFVSKNHQGYFVPNLFGYGGTTRGGYVSLAATVEIENTNNISGSYAAVPGASVADSAAPRFHVDAGETLYVGFLMIRGAAQLREQKHLGHRFDWGLIALDITVESRPDQARATLTEAGLDAGRMVERLANAGQP